MEGLEEPLSVALMGVWMRTAANAGNAEKKWLQTLEMLKKMAALDLERRTLEDLIDLNF